MLTNPSPETAARAFFEALERSEWHRAAEFVHPDTISAFRREASTLAEQWAAGPREATVEDLLRGNPDMPREVAEYNVRRAAEFEAQEGPMLSRFLAGVNDASEVAGLSDTGLYARHIEACDPRYQLCFAYARAGRPMPEAVRDGAAGIHRTALGVVMEGPAMAHVLFRKRWFDRDLDAPLGPVDVLTLEWSNEHGWRVRDFDFRGHGRGGWVTYGVPDEDDDADP